MYTNVQSPRRWNTVAPLLCILLLSFILFTIAVTIVISLISVYLPTRDVHRVSTNSGPQELTIPLTSDSTASTGSLDDATKQNIHDQVSSATSTHPEVSKFAVVQVTDATGAHLAKRKRRDDTREANVVIIIYEVIFSERCSLRRCRIRILLLIREILLLIRIRITGSHSSTPATNTPATNSSSGDEVTGDIALISQYWANVRPYTDNPDDFFGVHDTGLPDGCQVEQAFVLHRHGARYPGGGDLTDIGHVTGKLRNTSGKYTGPLAFFNIWTNQLGSENLLSEGTYMEYQSGVDFYVKYGRLLYNAPPGQNYYNATGQPKLQLRCNTVPRVTDSANAWANGFYALYNTTDKFTLLRMPAGTGLNNTLASFFSCRNFLNVSYGMFDSDNALHEPIAHYLTSTVARLKQYVPADVDLSVLDVFIMQGLCPFEYSALGSSDFCSVFTLNEWRGFRYTYDIYLYNGFSFGSPTGRALGLGVLQELIARLKGQTIPISDSSVNTTFDGSTTSFPLGQLFYLDMTHDFMILGILTAMSLDYFRHNLSPDDYPPPEDRHFKTTNVVPYAARIITEKIGCVSPNPNATNSTRTQYTRTQYGYSAASATNKFIRMRLNSGILPLDTIRGGYCAGRTDGLCPLDNFLASQANASAQANYAQICFGNFVYNASRFTGDGNYFP